MLMDPQFAVDVAYPEVLVADRGPFICFCSWSSRQGVRHRVTGWHWPPYVVSTVPMWSELHWFDSDLRARTFADYTFQFLVNWPDSGQGHNFGVRLFWNGEMRLGRIGSAGARLAGLVRGE